MNTHEEIYKKLILSYAKMLLYDLRKEIERPGFIGNFNCSHADGSPIVKGCSTEVWCKNINFALVDSIGVDGNDTAQSEFDYLRGKLKQ